MSILLNAGGKPHHELWMLALVVALSAALCVGFLTPIAALLTIPAYVLEIAPLRVAPAEVLVAVLQATALSLLGPGSYSIDAFLYGHRVVVLPHNSGRDAG